MTILFDYHLMFGSNIYRFLYDGNRIGDEDTPASLQMEDNDSIDVMVERERLPSLYRPSILNVFLVWDLQRSVAIGNVHEASTASLMIQRCL